MDGGRLCVLREANCCRGCEADHSPISGAEVKGGWSCISTPMAGTRPGTTLPATLPHPVGPSVNYVGGPSFALSY